MPELPEVETICRGFGCQIDTEVVDLEILHAGIIREQAYDASELIGQRLESVQRRGKFILLSFSSAYYLVVHLGMSGRFFMVPTTEAIAEKHIHFILHMSNGVQAVFQDTRRFGGLWFTKQPQLALGKLGVEPLTAAFNENALKKICQNRKQAIKGILLNQNLIAGIGNIYADEALFSAGIRPEKPGGELTADEIKKLVAAIKQVLAQSIQARGTTFRDYRDGQSQPGNFQNFLQVYGRKDQECVKCGNLISRVRLLGRGTHFCAHCQK